MTDRDLLEKAAKAADYDCPPGQAWDDGLTVCADDGWQHWNPLADDGDALRLANRLRINIEHMRTLAGADFGVNCWPVGRGDCGVSEEDPRDYDAAVRRAIVRAAAILGDQQ
jgi:hypothetical protein